MDATTYTRLLVDLSHVYRGLERSLDHHRDHPIVGPICFDELRRSHALEQDLRYFDVQTVNVQSLPSPAAQRYAARIDHVSSTAPELLVAHAYTRYLGDLSGGQILGNIVTRCLRLDGVRGAAFYRFDEVPELAAAKAAYRTALDRLAVSEAQAADIVAEANRAFELNMEVFEGLEGSLVRAFGALLTGGRRRVRHRDYGHG